MEEWRACQSGKETGHYQRCVEMARRIQNAAAATLYGRTLSVCERIALAHVSNEHLNGPVDRTVLAQSLVSVGSDIMAVINLAREVRGRRFGSDFQFAAIFDIARMTADDRASLLAMLKPLLAISNDESFVRVSLLQLLPMSAAARAYRVAALVMEAEQRAKYRGILSEHVGSQEAAALVEAVTAAKKEKREDAYRMCITIVDWVDAPVLLVTRLIQHEQCWADIAPFYERLAGVIFDPSLLGQETLRLITTDSDEHDTLVTKAVARTLSLLSLKDAVRTPEFAGLSDENRGHLLTTLMGIRESDQLTVLEICRPMIERLPWQAAVDGLSEVIDAQRAERLNCRNAILSRYERADVENVMNTRMEAQVNSAVGAVRAMLPEGFPTSETRSDAMKSIERHLFSYLSDKQEDEARDLLSAATIMHHFPGREKERDAAVAALTAAFSTIKPEGERNALMKLRADAPELANAWRTLSGDLLPQD